MVTDRLSVAKTRVRCAIYTRKSSEEGLEQDFNSLDAQREACEAFVRSQHGEGWFVLAVHFDDAGHSGGTLDRPALQTLLHEVRARKLDVVVVYKIDRLTRSLMDFSKIVEIFERHDVSIVSVTQRFDTTASLGRLTLNILLSFAQFEREVTADRIRDKIAASKKKGMWMGGHVPLGYEAKGRTLVINEAEAETVRTTFRLYLELGAVRLVAAKARQLDFRTKQRQDGPKTHRGNRYLSRGYIYKLLSNPIYAGIISYRGTDLPALHQAIIDKNTWKAVQQQLASNSKKHRIRSDAKQPSLLAGFIFDETGDRLTPVHSAKKGKKHYRYYVSNRLIRTDNHPIAGGLRVPAVQLEGIVTRALISLFGDARRLAEALNAGDVPILEVGNAVQHSRRRLRLILNEASSLGARVLLSQIMGRLVVGSGEITITLRVGQLFKVLTGEVHSDGCEILARGTGEATYDLTVQNSIRRPGVETRLVLAPCRKPDTHRDASLIALVARGFAWAQELIEDPSTNVTSIAARDGMAVAHVTRVVSLGFLAPDILEAILAGHQPQDLIPTRIVTDPQWPRRGWRWKRYVHPRR